MQVIDASPIEQQIDALAKHAGADRFGALPVVHRPNLFTPKRELVPAGKSIAEIVASIDDLPAIFWERGVVSIDRRDGSGCETVPRHMWRYVRPKADSLTPIEVNLWLPPESKGVRQIISLVAVIAVVAASIFITGGGLAPLFGSFFAAGTFGAQIAAAGFAIGASLAIQALSPPPSTAALTAGGSGALDNQISPASLSGNVLRPGSPIPHVRGRRKIYPPIVVKPLMEVVGDDEYATAVFALSGAHDLANIRADGVDLDSMEDVEHEVREGHSSDTVITLITRQSKTDTSVINLSQHEVDVTTTVALKDQTTPENSVPIWHAMRADGSPDEIWINLRWPTGLFDGDNPSVELATPVRVRIRAVGDTAWINLPEVLFAFRKQEPFQKDIRIIWGTAPTPPTPISTRSPYAAYSAVPMRWTDAGLTSFTDFNTGLATSANDGATTGGNWHKSGSTASAYSGFNAGTRPRKAVKAIVWPYNPDGFTNAASVTVNWRAKNSAPANAADGTLLATTGLIADTTSPQEFNSSDTTTEWQYQWIELVGSVSGNYNLAEVMFFDDGEWSWLANSHFYSGLLTGRMMRDTTIGTTQVRNIALYGDRAEIYLDSGTFPQGDYEIEIKRGAVIEQTAFDEPTYVVTGETRVADLFKWHYDSVATLKYEVPRDLGNVYYQMQRQRLSLIWNEHPLSNAPGNLALIAIKVKNRQISQLSVDAARYVLDWDGSDWITQSTTANPAAHVYDILAGDLNADPVPDDLIDNASLVAWRTRCATDSLTINAVLEGASADVVAQLAAGCGYARIRQSETFGVIQDQDRSAESPVQTFTSRNSRGYRFEKSFARLPSGLRVIYADSTDDYKETELIVVDPDGDGGARYEEIRYDGLVTAADVQARALFDLKQARVRMAFHSFDSNGQAIKCQRGDLIGLNHPVLKSQMAAGYVRTVLDDGGGNITGLVLDATVPINGNDGFFSGPDDFFDDLYGDGLFGPVSLGAVIRLHDGEGELSEEIDADVTETETRTITFTTPVAGPIAGLDRDCLVTVGALGEERLRLILGEIQPKAGPSYPATLVAVDEAPELWA